MRVRRDETYRLVGDEMVDVVAALPPSDGQAAAEVGDEHCDEGVDGEVGRDGKMGSVVSREHDLMLQDLLVSLTHESGMRMTNPE